MKTTMADVRCRRSIVHPHLLLSENYQCLSQSRQNISSSFASQQLGHYKNMMHVFENDASPSQTRRNVPSSYTSQQPRYHEQIKRISQNGLSPPQSRWNISSSQPGCYEKLMHVSENGVSLLLPRKNIPSSCASYANQLPSPHKQIMHVHHELGRSIDKMDGLFQIDLPIRICQPHHSKRKVTFASSQLSPSYQKALPVSNGVKWLKKDRNRSDSLLEAKSNHQHLSNYYVQDDMPESGHLMENYDRYKNFCLEFDLHHFRPEEITVHTMGQKLLVEAHHEERGNGLKISQEYFREHILPAEVDPYSVTSSFNHSGILCIKAPLPVTENKIIPANLIPLM